MVSKLVGLAMLAGTLAVPSRATAQATSPGLATVISLQSQVNLTNLPADLERIRLGCWITSPSYSLPAPSMSYPNDVSKFPGAELYVVQGKAVGDMTVQVPIFAAYLAPDAIGKQASYTCGFAGYSTSLQRWDFFSDQHTNPTFRLSPTPPNFGGTFVW